MQANGDDREDRRWVQRTVSFPVQECLSGPFPEFAELLLSCWQHSTSLATWAAHTLRRLDVLRTPAMPTLPPMPAADLYALAFGRARPNVGRQFWGCPSCKRKWHPSQTNRGNAPVHNHGTNPCPGAGRPTVPLPRPVLPQAEATYEGADFWAGAKAAAATLLRRVARDYARYRTDIVWHRTRRVPEYRFPYPFPVHQDQWVPLLTEQGHPAVNLALPGGRVSLRLRDGLRTSEHAHYERDLRVFRQLIDGELAVQELKLCGQVTHANVPSMTVRRPGGGHGERLRVMARIAYRLEVPACPAGKTAAARTGLDPFVTLLVPGEERLWVLHAPWVRQWVAEHRSFLQQFADDLKFEKRWPASKRRALNRRQERRCEKHARRLRTFYLTTAAQTVGHAARRGCDALRVDASDRSFAPEDFGWFALGEAFQNKCDELGLRLEWVASGETPNGAGAPKTD